MLEFLKAAFASTPKEMPQLDLRNFPREINPDGDEPLDPFAKEIRPTYRDPLSASEETHTICIDDDEVIAAYPYLEEEDTLLCLDDLPMSLEELGFTTNEEAQADALRRGFSHAAMDLPSPPPISTTEPREPLYPFGLIEPGSTTPIPTFPMEQELYHLFLRSNEHPWEWTPGTVDAAVTILRRVMQQIPETDWPQRLKQHQSFLGKLIKTP